MGWISGEVPKDPDVVPWVLTDKINVAISLMLAVNFYDRLHNQQMDELTQRNQALEKTQAALIQARPDAQRSAALGSTQAINHLTIKSFSSALAGEAKSIWRLEKHCPYFPVKRQTNLPGAQTFVPATWWESRCRYLSIEGA